ncbi:MAG: methyltransferase domain-containing protein [Acidobacteriota bacterium]|jgi:SAM-dependent methyltransferase
MHEPIPAAEIQAAEAYEDLHVAALFAEWAPRVLDAAEVGPGADVLDVACGTGVVARAALGRVGESGSVTGLDRNRAMLAIGERLAPAADWRCGDAAELPFEDQSFDAVVSQFGLMFFADRGAAIAEMYRVTRRGGRLVVAVWDALEASPAYPIEVELLERLAGSPAAEALRAPFVLGDAGELSGLFEEAGVADTTAATIVGTARFPSVRSMVEADLRGWLPVMGVHLEEEVIARILSEAESALARFVTADGALVFDSPAHIISGTRG